jgi:predicted dehydrogenase
MAKTLRVGIIGANAERGWARESHVPAVQKLAGLEFAAVANKGQDTADAAARAFGVAKAYGDAADMFRDPDIDLVTVAVTLPAHHALILGALEAGKHVYCEYPLGLDVAESEALAEAAQKSGVHSVIGLQTRGNPAARRARELVASGAIGRPLSVRVYSPTIGFGPVTNPAEAYTEKPENGVTVVTIQGAHTLDLVIALLGGFSDVSALASTLYPEIRIGDGAPQKRTTFDHILMQGRLASGAAASVEVAGGRPAGTPFRLDITGETGVLTLEGGAMRGFQAGRLHLVLDGEPQAVDEGESAGMPDGAANVAAVYAALRDDISHGTSTVTDFHHAVRMARLIADATASSQTGTRRQATDWPRQ